MIDQLLAEAKVKGQKLMAGVYAYNGIGYIDAEEICHHYGIPETRENVEWIRQEFRKIAMADNPEATWSEFQKDQTIRDLQ